MIQTSNRPITITNRTLNTLIVELGSECQTILTLLNQLQLPDLSPSQQAKILAELLTSTIYLQAHCDDDLQTLIAQEMEALPDTEEPDDD
jgi:hypothetical protein